MLRTFNRSLALFFLGLACAASGCATVVSGRHADVSFHSNVPNANVVIRNKRGEKVAITQAQSTVALKRNDRIIFPARYTATFSAAGYQPVDVPIDYTLNPWIVGNVVIGGLAGMTVDSVTGAAWKPKRSNIYQELSPAYGAMPYDATAQLNPQPSVSQAGPSAFDSPPEAPLHQTAASTNASSVPTAYR
jgi:hypothetical protein